MGGDCGRTPGVDTTPSGRSSLARDFGRFRPPVCGGDLGRRKESLGTWRYCGLEPAITGETVHSIGEDVAEVMMVAY